VMKGTASPNRNQAIAQGRKEIEISLMGRRKLREDACGSLCDLTLRSGGARCVPYYTAWVLRRDAEPYLHSGESGEIGRRQLGSRPHTMVGYALQSVDHPRT
jgi:hypothetical protein